MYRMIIELYGVYSSCYRNGIRVNAVLPGFIETPMTDVIPDKVIKQIVPLIPMGRMGKPEGNEVFGR